MDLIDLVDYLELSSVEEGFKLAVESLQEKVYGEEKIEKIKKSRKKAREVSVESRELKEIKKMISFITRMINDISNNIARAERMGSLITPVTAKTLQPAESSIKHDIDIDLGELKVSEKTEKKPKEPEKSLEDAIEDVLVVAIADEILKKDK